MEFMILLVAFICFLYSTGVVGVDDIVVDGVTVLKLYGTDTTAESRSIPPYTYNSVEYTTANCFDVGLYRVDSGAMIGTGTDCLRVIEEYMDVMNQSTLLVLGTTTFSVTGTDGILISQGLTTAQPVIQGSSSSYTHITGSLPSYMDDNIAFASGAYQGVSGPVRLSGAVNMAGEGVMFNCLFVLNLTCNNATYGCGAEDEQPTRADAVFNLDGVTTLRLSGTAEAVMGNVTDWTDPLYPMVEAMCFTVDLVHVESGMSIGTGTDCLAVQESYETDFGDAMLVLGTTTFNVDVGEFVGAFTTQGLTVAQPVVIEYPDMYTHITGSVPAEAAVTTVDAIHDVSGAGFDLCDEVRGMARLSGAVDMSMLANSSMVMFNCLFVVSVDCIIDEDVVETTQLADAALCKYGYHQSIIVAVLIAFVTSIYFSV